MDEDVKIYGHLLGLIEIPADVLLYWTLKATDLKGTVSEQDLHSYHDAICMAYHNFQNKIEKPLAFNFPYADNYQHEVFEEVILANGKLGFKIRKTVNSKARELLEYRLVKLEAFIRKQSPDIKELFELADEIYRKRQSTIAFTFYEESTTQQKILQFGRKIKQKFHIKKKK